MLKQLASSCNDMNLSMSNFSKTMRGYLNAFHKADDNCMFKTPSIYFYIIKNELKHSKYTAGLVTT